MPRAYDYRKMLFLIRDELAKAYGEKDITEDELNGIKRCLVAIEKRGIHLTRNQKIQDEDITPINLLLGKLKVILEKKPILQNYCHQLINDYVTREEIGKEIYDYGVHSFGEIEDTGREGIASYLDVRVANILQNKLGIIYMDELCLVPMFVLEAVENLGEALIQKIKLQREEYAAKYNLELEE